MKYSELKTFLKNNKHRKILITGPQRAGTSIAAKIISQGTGLPYVDEEDINIDDLNLFFKRHYGVNEGVICNKSYVMQAPGLSFICHRLPVDLVVFMQRDVNDIKKSAERISWIIPWNDFEAHKYLTEANSSWAVKYNKWREYQKPYMEQNNKMFFDLDYESLKSHPLWIDKSERTNFHARQTK